MKPVKKNKLKIKPLGKPPKGWDKEGYLYTCALLEDVQSNFNIFAENLSFVRDRVGEHSIKLDSISHELGLVKEDVTILKEDVAVLKEDVAEIKIRQTSMEQRQTRIEGDIFLIKNDIKELQSNDEINK